MHDASWPEESDQFILNCRRQAVPFYRWPELAAELVGDFDHAWPHRAFHRIPGEPLNLPSPSVIVLVPW
jgi:hypothetical protein